MKKVFTYLLIFLSAFAGFFSHAGREDAILGTALTILDFEEDQRGWLAGTPTLHQDQGNGREEFIQRVEPNLDSARYVIDKLEEVRLGKCALDDLLGALLEGRLVYLRNRTLDCVKGEMGRIDTQGTVIPALGNRVIIPCHDELYACNFKVNEFNEKIRAGSLKRYQYMQLIIRQIWEVLKPEELSRNTRDLLSLSPHLWPLLRGDTYDLGSPDEAGGYAPLLFLRNYLIKKKKRLKGEKRTYLPTAAILYNTPEKISEMEIGELQSSFDQFRTTCDAELYEVYKCDTCLRTWEVRQLGGPAISTTAWIPAAMDNPKKWPERRVPTDLLTHQEESATSVNLGPSLFAPPPRARKRRVTRTVIPASLTAIEKETEIPLTTIEKLPPPETFREERGEESPTALDGRSSPHPAEVNEFEQRAHTSAVPVEALALTFDYPRGLRIGHKYLLEQARPVRETPTSQLAFVQQLFNPAQCNNITYDEFDTFWRSLGGRLEGRSQGGSHFHLIAPEGIPLWGSFRPHRSSSGYGSCTIKYLQAAAWWAGIRPQ